MRMDFSPTLLTSNYEGKLSGWINFDSSGPSLSLGKARVIGTQINSWRILIFNQQWVW